MKILVAMPSYTGQIPSNVVLGLFSMKKPIPITLYFIERTPIDVARNKTVEYAIENGHDYILFIDDDTIVEPDTLEKLLKADKDIVGGVYLRRNSSIEKTKITTSFLDIKDDRYTQIEKFEKEGLNKVIATGTGCMLIKRKVFERLHQLYLGAEFQFLSERRGDKIISQGEDITFCVRAEAEGFEVWVDSTVRPGHIESLRNILKYEE